MCGSRAIEEMVRIMPCWGSGPRPLALSGPLTVGVGGAPRPHRSPEHVSTLSGASWGQGTALCWTEAARQRARGPVRCSVCLSVLRQAQAL